MSATLAERLANSTTPWIKSMTAVEHNIRVATPAIIQSFDPDTQTVTVRVAITEQVLDKNRVAQPTPIQVITHVPVYVSGGGGFSITFPIQAGDECLLICSDACIDSWFQSGGVQNQMDKRRHDLSDAIALVGLRSQPRKVTRYSTDSVQIRSDDGNTVIDLADGQATVTATTVTVQAQHVNVSGSEQVSISGNGNTLIEGVNFKEHTHSGVTAGGGVTGPVVG